MIHPDQAGKGGWTRLLANLKALQQRFDQLPPEQQKRAADAIRNLELILQEAVSEVNAASISAGRAVIPTESLGRRKFPKKPRPRLSAPRRTTYVPDAWRPAGEKPAPPTQASGAEARQAQSESAALFQGLFEFGPDAVIGVDQSGQIILANQQALQMFGYPPEELVGQTVQVLMPEMYRDRHRRHIKEYMQAPRLRPMGECLGLYGLHKEGHRFPVDITLGPLETGSRRIVLATIRDTTRSKQAEAALQEREKLLHAAISAAPISFIKLDRQGVIQFSLGNSPPHQRSQVNPTGQSIYELFADVPHIIQAFERALGGVSLTTTLEVDSQVFYASFAPVQDETGQISGVVWVALDVTDTRLMTDALRKSERRFQTIFTEADLGIELIDLKGRIVESNPAFQNMLGYDAGELHERSILNVTHPDDVPLSQSNLNDLFNGLRDNVHLEKRFLHRDGQVVWGRQALSLFRSEQGEPQYVIGMVEDITRQKQMQADLDEVQRRLLESGEAERLHLAQELHDGPLQDLEGLSYQMAALRSTLSSETDPERGDDQQTLLKQVSEMQTLTHEVIQAVRAICGELRPPALAPFGLEKAIRSQVDRIQAEHPEIEIQASLMPDGRLFPERVRLALYRIFQHLLLNVVRHAEARHVLVRFTFDETKIVLDVRDDGCGFQVPGRWVELVRKGHFGLAGAIERAEAIGGELKIESAPGEGTRIRVIVPRSEVDRSPEGG